MPKIKVGSGGQVVIPKEICEELGLKEGDFIEVNRSKDTVVIKPKKKSVEADDTITPEEEELVRKGEEQLKRGEYVEWDDLKKRLKL